VSAQHDWNLKPGSFARWPIKYPSIIGASIVVKVHSVEFNVYLPVLKRLRVTWSKTKYAQPTSRRTCICGWWVSSFTLHLPAGLLDRLLSCCGGNYFLTIMPFKEIDNHKAGWVSIQPVFDRSWVSIRCLSLYRLIYSFFFHILTSVRDSQKLVYTESLTQ